VAARFSDSRGVASASGPADRSNHIAAIFASDLDSYQFEFVC